MKNNKISPVVGIFLVWLLFLFLQPQSALAQTYPDPDKIKYPPLHFKMPVPERIILKNGMTLFYLPDSEIPLVTLSVVIRSGSAYDPLGKEGVGELTAYLLRTGGTQKIDSNEMDRRLDVLAASPSISMSVDSASVSYTFFKEDLDACLDLLSQMLIKPAFDDKKFQLAVSLKREELRRIADNPQKLAIREFNRLIYTDNPRGRYPTSDSLGNIRRSDLIEFHKRFFSPSNMMVALSGDISLQQAVDKIEHYFSDFDPSFQPPKLLPVPKKIKGQTFIIRKTIPQSTIVTGELTIGKDKKDYFSFSLLDFIAGSGGFSSRIFSEVRNNKGLAYSAGSFYRARGNYGVFGTYAFTKTQSTVQTLDLIRSILKDVSSGTITSKELKWAQKSILNGFIFSFERPSQITSQQMNLAYEDLPADFFSNYTKNIESVTLNDLKRVASQYFKKENMLIVVLCDMDQIGKLPATWGTPVYIVPRQ